MLVQIPFSGFYESMWSRGIDDEEERVVESLVEEHGLEAQELTPLVSDKLKYGEAFEYVAQEYVDYFEGWLNAELDLNIKLTFNRMTSPRYYNFETDHIVVDISYRDALILARKVGRNALRKAAKAMFTSRSGFISFYCNDPAEWGRLRGWDECQLKAVFEAALEVVGDDDWDWQIYEVMSGNGVFNNAVDKAVDWRALDLEIGKLLGKKELLEEQEDEKDEDRLYPTNWRSTEDYVAKYNALNQRIFNPYSDGVL